VKITVVGSGIPDLAAACLLDRAHEVHVFELRNRLGGYPHSVIHPGRDEPIARDTGFKLFNHRSTDAFVPWIPPREER